MKKNKLPYLFYNYMLVEQLDQHLPLKMHWSLTVEYQEKYLQVL